MDRIRQPGSLSEAKAAQLLDRAAKLDAEGGTRVAVDELRQVAIEAGISAESFERALAEIGAAKEPAARSIVTAEPAVPGVSRGKRAGSLLSAVLRRAGLFLAGSVLSIVSMTLISDVGMDSEAVMVFTLVVAAMMVMWSAVTKRRKREVLEFEVDLGVLWIAMTFWLMLLNPSDVGDVLEIMMPGGFLASLLGGLVVATGHADPDPEQLPERV
jgi:hypothetical protein